ncbi:MAG TPA: PAS domain S-box protein, partial [Thermodesulfobacteriota bacterium]|nr:PAS domain S-box protein [Thermodesulfobacteriota bacterium]
MILLDMRTLVFSNVVTDILCLLVVFLLWRQSRNRFAGMGFWVFDYTFQTAAMLLIILRGSIPDWASMVLSNTLVIGGALLGYMGLGRFVGKKVPQGHNYVLLAAFASFHAYFTHVQPALAARNLNVSVALLIICFQCMWFLVYGVKPGMRRLTFGVAMVFGGYCLVSLVRIAGFFTGTSGATDYFRSGAFESLILISYQMLFILLTYSLVLMVNKRLFVDVQTEEEKFSKAFRSSPYAITLTRLSDGQIVDVNDGFLKISGYSYPEAIGKTTTDLHLWDRPEDRGAAVAELGRSGKVEEREYQFRKKLGETLIGLFSAHIIPVGNDSYVLSSINDITERKKAEQALRESEAKANALIKYAPTGIYEVDYRTAGFINVNDAMCQILGYTREELFAMGPAALLDDKGRMLFANRIRRQLAGEKVEEAVEYRVRKKGGKFIDAILNVSFIAGSEPGRALVVAHDITARKRAEQELEQARNTLAEAQKIAHLGSFEYVAATRTTMWSEEEYRIYGLDPAGPSPAYELMLAKCIHPDDAALLHETFTQAMQTRSIYELEHRIVRPDGSVRWVYDLAHPYFDEKGNLLRYVGATLDITERKRAEERLRRQQGEIQTLLENTPAGLVLFEANPPYKVLAHNRYYQELFAEPFRSQGMVGLNVYEYAPAVEAEGVVAVFDEVVRTRQPKSFLDFPYKSDPPNQTWFNWHMSPLILDGEVVALVS